MACLSCPNPVWVDSETRCVALSHWIGVRDLVQAWSILIPRRIALEPPPQRRMIRPVADVVEARLGIEAVTGEEKSIVPVGRVLGVLGPVVDALVGVVRADGPCPTAPRRRHRVGGRHDGPERRLVPGSMPDSRAVSQAPPGYLGGGGRRQGDGVTNDFIFRRTTGRWGVASGLVGC